MSDFSAVGMAQRILGAFGIAEKHLAGERSSREQADHRGFHVRVSVRSGR